MAHKLPPLRFGTAPLRRSLRHRDPAETGFQCRLRAPLPEKPRYGEPEASV